MIPSSPFDREEWQAEHPEPEGSPLRGIAIGLIVTALCVVFGLAVFWGIYSGERG